MTRAAEALGVSQPALSAMLRKLEDELGAPLFDRTGRGVEPTAAGAAFIEHAREAIRAVDAGVRAVRELEGLEAGTVRIGGGATATGSLVPDAVGTLRHDHPALRFLVREAGSAAVAAAVVSGELEIGIVTLPVRIPDAGELITVATAEDELRLITPPGHRLADRTSFRWDDLRGEPVIGFEAGSAVRALVDDAAAAHGVTLDIVMELRSIQSIRRMVETGVGVGFVSRFALSADQPGLSAEQGAITRTLGVVRRRDRVPSAAVAAFERALLATIEGRTAP